MPLLYVVAILAVYVASVSFGYRVISAVRPCVDRSVFVSNL